MRCQHCLMSKTMKIKRTKQFLILSRKQIAWKVFMIIHFNFSLRYSCGRIRNTNTFFPKCPHSQKRSNEEKVKNLTRQLDRKSNPIKDITAEDVGRFFDKHFPEFFKFC